MTPSPPAFETAAAKSAVPTRIMPPQMIGALIPRSSVSLVRICRALALSDVSSFGLGRIGRRTQTFKIM